MEIVVFRHVWLACAVLVMASSCRAPVPDPTPESPAEPAQIRFTEVTEEAGLGDFRHRTGAFGEMWFPETMGAGGGFLDYDGDGELDILLVAGAAFPSRGGSATPAVQLFRNEGEGRFLEVTASAGLSGLHSYALGVTAADYDNDGDTDVFVTTLFENLLLRNDGGAFEEVGSEAGLSIEAQWSSAAVFFDADRDGFVDLYVGNYVDWTPEKDIFCTRVGQTKSYCTPELYEGLSGRFYHNEGDGTFTDQSARGGFDAAPGKTLAAASLDYNRDGWPDLVVANDTQRDLLFENQGDGHFVEKGVVSGIAFDENGRARAGMGIDAGVVDASGEVTVFVGHFSSEMVGVYRHSRDGFFTDLAAVSQIGRPSLRTLTFGLLLLDVDLDADLDLLTANGHITEDIELVEDGITFRQRTQVYANQGGGRFSEVPTEASDVFSAEMVARGAAYGDYDRDGDIDVLITENGGPVHLWRNDLDGGNYLRVLLEGSRSNRNGIGARVVVASGGLRQERFVRAGASYLSQSQITPVFGLADADRVDSLWVYWPSGTVSRHGPVEANRDLRIVEGDGAALRP